MLAYEDIVKAIQTQQTCSAYLLWGEEPLFIDKLAELFSSTLIEQEERDLNQTILYGHDKEVTLSVIISEAMRYPMMGKRVLVLVREAQQIKDIDDLAPYIAQLPSSTCLVLCYKKKVDKRKGLYKAFDTLGTHYESVRIRDNQVSDFIVRSFRDRHMHVETPTAQIMADHTGNDLEKILSEIDKMSIVMGVAGGVVTPDLIEEHIGISKEFNTFELMNALVNRDAERVFRIVAYFVANERTYPIQMVLPTLFNFFAQLMAVYYLSDRSERAIATQLGISPYVARSYTQASMEYSASGVFGIIRQIRMTDAASKGVDSSLSGGELLRELVAYILSA